MYCRFCVQWFGTGKNVEIDPDSSPWNEESTLGRRVTAVLETTFLSRNDVAVQTPTAPTASPLETTLVDPVVEAANVRAEQRRAAKMAAAFNSTVAPATPEGHGQNHVVENPVGGSQPLPPGWSEDVAADGSICYFNKYTKTKTAFRPTDD